MSWPELAPAALEDILEVDPQLAAMLAWKTQLFALPVGKNLSKEPGAEYMLAWLYIPRDRLTVDSISHTAKRVVELLVDLGVFRRYTGVEVAIGDVVNKDECTRVCRFDIYPEAVDSFASLAPERLKESDPAEGVVTWWF